MNRTLIFDTIPYCLAVTFGVILFASPYSSRLKATSSRHYLTAIVFVGFAAAIWGLLGLADAPLHPYLSSHMHYLLHKHKDMCAGAMISIIFLEFFSGEFLAALRRDKEWRRERASRKATSPPIS